MQSRKEDMVKILQLNMHRGRVADALLPQIIAEQDADIAIISEQYTRKENGYWIEDDTATAAIWISNDSSLIPTRSGRGNCFVWVQFNNVTVISCYLTPRDRITEFENKLEEIEQQIKEIKGHLIVAGDFNARAAEWGTATTNSRGRRILEMAARTGLTIANVGNTPTFRRPGCEGTIPDLTLVSERTAPKIKNWRVIETYTASDHQYVSYSFVMNSVRDEMITRQSSRIRKWNSARLNRSALIAEVDARLDDVQNVSDAGIIVRRVMKIITEACNKSMPKLRNGNSNRKPVFWWNEEIANRRRECVQHRRRYTRARAHSEAEAERAEYKEARKRLQYSIFESKRKLWEELRENVNENPWGTGYKLVMKKLGAKKPTPLMNQEHMENIVKSLFPEHDALEDRPNDDEEIFVPLFTTDELSIAASGLKNNKAPGPDGIPVEVMKEVASTRPQFLLKMYNCCLKEGLFPETWKTQRLVLIRKGEGDPLSPSTYRPLCMLNTAGKLLERLLKSRLAEAIQTGGGLSERQHGFRPGRSTIGAIKDVVDVVEMTRNQNHFTRPLVLLATLDVKNAFNSLRWSDILKTLEENFRIPEYLLRIIRDYLRNRELLYSTTDGQRRMRITSGAAQGSILGPDLWNITYDGILRAEMPRDSFLVGYADDIAAVIKGRNVEDVTRKLRQVMIRVKTWLGSRGLQLATQKTELLLLTRKHMPVEIDIRIDEDVLATKTMISYLGIKLDTKLTFSHQFQHAASKAGTVTTQLARLMANIGGPLPNKRKLLMEVSNSILLYGCEIWADKTTMSRRASSLLAVQRIAALRITSAYRTVSAAAVFVIAGTTPIDLVAIARRKIWASKYNGGIDPTEADGIRQEAILNWQARWNTNSKGRWTARLIPRIDKWINRGHGEVNYYLTQMLSGHGYYRKYLYRAGKCSTPYCLYEEREIVDDVEHTFFECSKWSDKRIELERSVGFLIPENIIDVMMQSEENWRAVSKYCEFILQTKKPDLDTADR